MFYHVKIGNMTRRGNLIAQVEKVVEFDGKLNELQMLMRKQYNGFDIECYTIEKIENLKKEKMESNKLTKDYIVSKKVLANRADIPLRDILPNELLTKLKETKKYLNKLEEETSQRIKEKLSERLEIHYVDNIRYDSEYNSAYANLYLNCDLYLSDE